MTSSAAFVDSLLVAEGLVLMVSEILELLLRSIFCFVAKSEDWKFGAIGSSLLMLMLAFMLVLGFRPPGLMSKGDSIDSATSARLISLPRFD